MNDEKVLDCRDMACPAPVLDTKNALEKEPVLKIKVIVDNDAAVENVTRFLKYQGFGVSVKEEKGIFSLFGTKLDKEPAGEASGDTGPGMEKSTDDSGETASKIMIMVASDTFGSGDDGLGQKLMVNFLNTVEEIGDELWRLVFVNNGVKLTVKGSAGVDAIRSVEKQGVLVLVCGTCLGHFDLMEKKAVGQTTNMLDIVTSMQLADKVITL